MELPCAWQSCICLRAGQPGAKTERIAVKKVRTRRRAVTRAPGKASVRGAVARPTGVPSGAAPMGWKRAARLGWSLGTAQLQKREENELETQNPKLETSRYALIDRQRLRHRSFTGNQRGEESLYRRWPHCRAD